MWSKLYEFCASGVNLIPCSLFQFAQFALMTQTVAVFGTYVLQFTGSQKIKVIILGQAVGNNMVSLKSYDLLVIIIC